MSILVMDEIWVREPRLMVPRQKPIGPVRIATENPLTAGITGLYFVETARGLVTKNLVRNNADLVLVSSQITVLPEEVTVAATTAGNYVPNSVISGWDRVVNSYTVFWVARYNGDFVVSTSGRSLEASTITAGQPAAFQIIHNATGTDIYAQASNGTTAYATPAPTLINDNTLHSYAAVFTPTFIKLYQDGVLSAENTDAPSGTCATSGPVYLGNRPAGDRDSTVKFALLGFAFRAWSPAEVADWHDDWYQVVAPA